MLGLPAGREIDSPGIDRVETVVTVTSSGRQAGSGVATGSRCDLRFRSIRCLLSDDYYSNYHWGQEPSRFVLLGSVIMVAGNMPDKSNQPLKGSPRGILRRGDQLVLAAVALFGLGGILCWWMIQGGGRGNLVEFDKAVPHEVVFQVDANQATWSEFAQLPGIGETLARRIVEERRRRGPFQEVADLPRRVHGIGPKKFQKIEPYLYLGQPSRPAN
jgi:competence protein ComEA